MDAAKDLNYQLTITDVNNAKQECNIVIENSWHVYQIIGPLAVSVFMSAKCHNVHSAVLFSTKSARDVIEVCRCLQMEESVQFSN